MHPISWVLLQTELDKDNNGRGICQLFQSQWNPMIIPTRPPTDFHAVEPSFSSSPSPDVLLLVITMKEHFTSCKIDSSFIFPAMLEPLYLTNMPKLAIYVQNPMLTPLFRMIVVSNDRTVVKAALSETVTIRNCICCRSKTMRINELTSRSAHAPCSLPLHPRLNSWPNIPSFRKRTENRSWSPP